MYFKIFFQRIETYIQPSQPPFMGFLDRLLHREHRRLTDNYRRLSCLEQEKALPRPPRTVRLIPFKEARIARLQAEAVHRVKYFGDPNCGLPPGFLEDDELRYLRYNLTQLFFDVPPESYRFGFGLHRVGPHDYYSAILVTSIPGKEPRTLLCSERIWHRYPFTPKETQKRALEELIAEIQSMWDKKYYQKQNGSGEWIPWWRQFDEPPNGRAGF
ncbi:hypothetical protein EJ08DRAFT_679884 [Tothia fuscella]|uniref:Uncharacterized protein n=1 Tax=Tothia fuscella TaxID=1048955 RepID=A0A9P4TXE8_9PEZI|nr:hypothetical protein EJ08DRAFT_679884 [Tothia fuscella]